MKPVLLLIPGMLNTASVWREVVPLLASRFDVRIADVQTQSSIAEMARDAWARVADTREGVGVPLHVCGFSMGGFVAIEMIAGHDRRVDGLVLLDTSARPESPESAALREKTIAAITRDFDKVIAGVAQFGTDEARHEDASWMAALRASLREVGPETAIRQNRAIVDRADHRKALADLRIPVRVVCGRSDRITPPELSRELATLIPSAELEWIEGAGHMTPLEAPAQVAAAIAALLVPQARGSR